MPSHALAARSPGLDLAWYVTPEPGAEPAGSGAGVPEGAPGTLLAVVPIPGTERSLAIVGYQVPVSAAPDSGPRSSLPGGPGSSAPGGPGSSAPGGPGSSAPGGPGSSPPGGPGSSPPGGALVVDHARRRVWLDGAEVRLTYQEFELLAFLSANPAQVFRRADLLARVWPQCPPSNTRTVDVHVSRLRRKLGPVHGQCLATEYRVGYRFDPA